MEMFEISNHLVEYKGVIYGHNIQLFFKRKHMTFKVISKFHYEYKQIWFNQS